MQLQIRNKTTYNSDSKGWLNTEQIPVQLETLCVLVPLFLWQKTKIFSFLVFGAYHKKLSTCFQKT